MQEKNPNLGDTGKKREGMDTGEVGRSCAILDFPRARASLSRAK